MLKTFFELSQTCQAMIVLWAAVIVATALWVWAVCRAARRGQKP